MWPDRWGRPARLRRDVLAEMYNDACDRHGFRRLWLHDFRSFFLTALRVAKSNPEISRIFTHAPDPGLKVIRGYTRLAADHLHSEACAEIQKIQLAWREP